MPIDPVSVAGGALAALGTLSKPATILIDRMSDAVGGIAKPWQMKRVARAEAMVKAIRTQSKLDICEIEQRALVRFMKEEGKKQENIERITAGAIPHLSPEAKPEDIDGDFLVHLFDKSRLVSDAEMQSMWSRILAGEANRAGSFSKRTVDMVSTLDKQDAKFITDLCKFLWVIGGTLVPVVFDENDPIITDNGIEFDILNHLDDIGVISYLSIGYNLDVLNDGLVTSYFGKKYILKFNSMPAQIRVGRVLLTAVGQQLATICVTEASESIRQMTLRHWQGRGITVTESDAEQ